MSPLGAGETEKRGERHAANRPDGIGARVSAFYNYESYYFWFWRQKDELQNWSVDKKIMCLAFIPLD